MNNFWESVKTVFEQKWWQGFGGIAQLIAAILTIISVRQAKKMFNLAKKERKESVEPSWDIVSNDIETKISSPGEYYNLEGQITLLNSGYGPARNLEINFESFNGNEPIEMGKGNKNVIFPKDKISIKFKWNVKKPPIGTLVLNCVTRLGHKTVKKIKIDTYFEVNHMNFGNWKLKWVSDKSQRNIFQKAYTKIKNILGNDKKEKSNKNIHKKIKKYYQMEKWVNNNFKIQGGTNSRGSIIVNRRERETENGGKVVSTIGIQVHKFVSMFGLLDVPPTAAELQEAIPENENIFIWNKRIKKWLEEGIIKEGKGYEYKDLNSPKPKDFKNAVKYSLEKMNYKDLDSVNHHKLVGNVREYFNKNDIKYGTFSFHDVEPYLKEIINE